MTWLATREQSPIGGHERPSIRHVSDTFGSNTAPDLRFRRSGAGGVVDVKGFEPLGFMRAREVIGKRAFTGTTYVE